MSDETPSSNPRELEIVDEIDVLELIKVVWSGRVIILLITLVACFLTFITAILLPDTYRAYALLAPNTGEGSNKVASLLSGYGTIAGMAGINLGNISDGPSRTVIAIERLQSKRFFQEYLYEGILVDLMASERWDRTSGNLEIDRSIYDIQEKKWIRDLENADGGKPSIQEAHDIFVREHLAVDVNPKTDLVTVAIEHSSPIVSKEWVDLIVASINEASRQTDINDSERAINFLVDQQRATSVVSLMEVFSQLIEEQMKTMMLANVSEEYIFRTIDPAVISEVKSRPDREFIAYLGFFIGVILGILGVLGKYYFRRV